MTTNINDVEKQVLALLCDSDDPWTWGPNAHSIWFESNGTGAITATGEQRDWVTLEINWSFTSRPIMVANGTWKFTIQMTLTTCVGPQYHTQNPWLKGAALQDHLQNPPSPSKAPFPWAPLDSAAFRLKQYTLTLSRGRYIGPSYSWNKEPYPIFQKNSTSPSRYEYQLVFDASPYPPREEWKEPVGLHGGLKRMLDHQRYWERREFVRREISKKDETWAEWLGLGWWLSPAIGAGHLRR